MARAIVKREYLDFLDTENAIARVDEMVKANKTRLVANINDLRTFKAERAQKYKQSKKKKRLLCSLFACVNMF